MSVIAKALKQAGMSLEADKLPKSDRTVKGFQRLIAAMRAVEAEVSDQMTAVTIELTNSQRLNLELQQRLHDAENKLRGYELSRRLQGIESLTTADRTRLLEVAEVA